MPVSIIIPACNEEKTVAKVVEAAVASGDFVDIIVVDDGSCDRTAKFAEEAGAKVVRLPKNRGKGEAIRAGLEKVSECVGVVLLWDADLTNIRPQHFRSVAGPIERNEADMVIGVIPTIGQRLAPAVSGLRAMPIRYLRQFFVEVQNIQVQFSLERRINEWFARSNSNRQLLRVQLPGIKHRTKIQKLGFWHGIWAWIIMWKDILGE